MMHENKVGKAKSLHLFHTTVRHLPKMYHMFTTFTGSSWLYSLVLRPLPPPIWPGNEASMIQLYAL